jgi:hypothetical protein
VYYIWTAGDNRTPEMTTNVREWAREYRARGWAICRLQAGEKRPTYRGWNRRSIEPHELRDTDNVGLQVGPLSNGLVVVDLDSRDAVALADRYLPPTDLVDGRPGKQKSHWWYVVTPDLPPELTAPATAARGIAGTRPATKHFRLGDANLIDLLGTGLQAVVPVSVWTGPDGRTRERRLWHAFGEPRVIHAAELYECVTRLAVACGWTPKERPARPEKTRREVDVPVLPVPDDDAVVRQARNYLRKVPPAVEGHGGDAHTWQVACLLVIDFGLTPERAVPVLAEWNRKCLPPWTLPDLLHKLEAADALEGRERGWRVRRSGRVSVHFVPNDRDVVVGVDAAAVGEGRSFVDLAPSLHAGAVRVGTRRELAPELASVDWAGKRALLAPPSTVATNQAQVWAEYHLARLLRRQGAEVVSLHLPPLNGRRRTLADAEGVNWKVVEPPHDAAQAAARARQAADLARALDHTRKKLPRRKPSPKLAAALAFVREHNVTSLTKDVLQKAREEGVSKDSLRRALGRRTNTPSTSSPRLGVSGPSIRHQPPHPGAAA